MTNFSRGKRFKIIAIGMVIFSLALCINSIFQAIRWIDKPFPGFLIYNNLIVSQVTLPHWAQNQGFSLQAYDKIIEVDEKRISRSDEVYSIIASKPLSTTINYLILRNNNFIELTIPTMKFTISDFLQVFGIEFVIGLIFITTGAFVYFLKPDLLSSKVFLLFCSSIGIWFVEDFNYQTTYSLIYSVNISYLAQILSPALLIYLTLIFPNEKEFFTKHRYIVLFPIFFSLALFILQLIFIDKPVTWEKIDSLIWFYLVFATLMMLVSVTVSYLRPDSDLSKQRAQVVLLGAFLGFFLPALAAAIFILFESSNINYLAIPVLFFPLSIAYAIAKHKLFDIDVIIQKALVYGALTGVLGGVLALMVVAFNLAFASYGGWRNPVFFILLTLFLVIALNPIKNRIQDLIDLMFFRKRYDYRRTIEEISSAMTSFLNLDEIINKIITTTQQTMFSNPVFVILFDWNIGDYLAYATNKSTPSTGGVIVKKNSELIGLLKRYREGIFKEDLTADQRYIRHRDEIIDSFEDFNAAIFIPMFSKEQLIGIISLGEKKSGLTYSSEDIKLLNTLANQSAIAIENAFTYKLVEDYANKLKEANEELRETQEQLIQAEKMSAIGQLAAGIAHEIRNPLNIIEGSRYYLSQVIDEGNSEVLSEYLGYIKHEIERTNNLIDNLLKFSKVEAQHFELLDVNTVLENALILVRKQLSDSSVGIIKNLDYQIPHIRGDQSQLWQVFINIIINAAQAMLQGGELRIDTGYGNRDHIFISFTDTGVGIDEKDITKIFNPFFTTKAKGTGLGLSISYRIIEEHKGRIRVSSEKGKGTTFVVELPISDNTN